jgi:hypothetical protein
MPIKKGFHKMNSTLHLPTFILALFGSLGGLASIIIIVKCFIPGVIEGKIISRYNNLNEQRSHTFFLYKLSILSKNKPFNLRQIKCEIEDINGNRFIASAINNRLVKFVSPEDKNKLQKLIVPGDEFLNNSCFLPANKNISGYLFFKFEGNLDREIRSTTFFFESFGQKIKKMKFKESDILGEQLFWDNSIWQTVSDKERKY